MKFIRSEAPSRNLQIGAEYGNLTVVGPCVTEKGRASYVCQCSCGSQKIVQGTNLMYGKTTSCGCRKGAGTKSASQTITIGRTFGKLTVIGKCEMLRGHACYPCVCECGCSKLCDASRLLNGKTTTCGCRSGCLSRSIRVGSTYGRWEVIGPMVMVKDGEHERSAYPCRCECKTERLVIGWQLTSGHSKSCGCYKADKTSERFRTHGDTGTRLHRIHAHVISRCENESAKCYKDYGGRGILVCQEWRKDFTAFREWAIRNGYDDKLTIDRVDVNGDYEPSNCRWVNRRSQSRNKRGTIYATAFGETKPIADWVEDSRCVVGYQVLRSRLRKGWDDDKAIFTPIGRKKTTQP